MAKGSSKAKQGRYAAYKTSNTRARNAARKIAKHIKAQPNDEQAKLALKSASFSRKAPKSAHWTSKTKESLGFMKSIIPNKEKTVIKGMFSLKLRAALVSANA